LIGARVIIKQENNGLTAKVVGATRVPPEDVDSYILNVARRVDFIRENYHQSGFDNLSEFNEAAGFWGCGRKLGDEKEFPNRPIARQSRIAFLITPSN
jgi:hypothetical protein